MNHLDSETLRKANIEAIYNIYLYLADKTTPQEDESLQSIVLGLDAAFRNQMPYTWSDRDLYRLNILINAIRANPVLAASKIRNLTRSKSGLTACSFTKPDGSVSFVFRGTGSGEWIDNGEGLSGIPEENTYITYAKGGTAAYHETVTKDYATDQQVEALNWFNHAAAKDGWNFLTDITVSGHSKGGNKAQFVAIHSDLVDDCFSFDGQGFSPEPLTALKKSTEQNMKNAGNTLEAYLQTTTMSMCWESILHRKNRFTTLHHGRVFIIWKQCLIKTAGFCPKGSKVGSQPI